jgi:hypothetical protein
VALQQALDRAKKAAEEAAGKLERAKKAEQDARRGVEREKQREMLKDIKEKSKADKEKQKQVRGARFGGAAVAVVAGCCCRMLTSAASVQCMCADMHTSHACLEGPHCCCLRIVLLQVRLPPAQLCCSSSPIACLQEATQQNHSQVLEC